MAASIYLSLDGNLEIFKSIGLKNVWQTPFFGRQQGVERSAVYCLLIEDVPSRVNT